MFLLSDIFVNFIYYLVLCCLRVFLDELIHLFLFLIPNIDITIFADGIHPSFANIHLISNYNDDNHK